MVEVRVRSNTPVVMQSPGMTGRIQTVDPNIPRVNIPFVVVGEEISDSVSTSYSLPGGNPLKKLVIAGIAEKYVALAGLARKNEGIQPKTLSFKIQWRASKSRMGKYSTGYTISDIQGYIAQLQALCFPMIGAHETGLSQIAYWAKVALGRSFVVCRLTLARLYDLVIVVTQVAVTWSNLWRLSEGKPMGADVNLGVEAFAYWTYEDVVSGQGFYEGGWAPKS